jgi:hypothetical protein
MLTYISNLDLSFRKGGEKITYKKGDKIDPRHEHHILSHYAGRVRSSSGGAGVGGSGGYIPERHEIEPSVDKPRENLGGIKNEIAKQGKKLDKIMDSIEGLSQVTVAPQSVSTIPEEIVVPSHPIPEIKEIVLDSVVRTEGISKSGDSVDGRSEGEDIEAKLEKLRNLKGSKKKKKKGE